ncbi:hypothetical protein [Desulforegula conservatrix]|uniref:hypothetical protein n=1 Tax=Desulforegula conservatrix TaxID=153026 RepID=UPI000405085F|nr:hypothetical protein [Desulforegula conservatrix]
MNPEQQYTVIKEVASKLGVEVKEKNLHVPGIRVKSGLCKVRGKQLFILDKKKTLREKVALIAGCVSDFDYQKLEIPEEVKTIIYKYSGVSDDGSD